jgi:uncharacterized paraquat-inducible protein A
LATETREQTSEELQQIQIWKCPDADCRAWVREEFATATPAICPLCKGTMVRSYKHVPVAPAKGRKKFLVGRRR